MKFNYQARTKIGEIQSGIVEAVSEEAALNLLQKHGLYITLLEAVGAKPIYARKIKLFERISPKELVMFSRQLSIMLKANVPLVEALGTLAVQSKNADLREKILKISEDVEGGTAFSAALARYPKVFSSFYISITKSGEASGKLSDVIDYLAEHLEREYHLVSKMRGALIYPSLIVFVVFAVLFLMMFFVIPQLSRILLEGGKELPLVTRIVIGFSDFLRKWSLALGLGLVGPIILAIRYYRSKSGKSFFDKLFLRLPLVGPFLKMIYLSRFAENLSTLISSGLPIAKSLEITANVVDNAVYKSVIVLAQEKVRKGESISSVLEKNPKFFPPMLVQMTVVGEKTGTLDKTLLNIVEFYQKETDMAINNLLSVLEPILIVFLGVIVAGLVGAILLPLYQMTGI